MNVLVSINIRAMLGLRAQPGSTALVDQSLSQILLPSSIFETNTMLDILSVCLCMAVQICVGH